MIEEIDVVAPSKKAAQGRIEQRLCALLSKLLEDRGCNGKRLVTVIGTTNQLPTVEPSLLQHTRFSMASELPCPDLDSREAILGVICRSMAILQGKDSSKVSALGLRSVAERAHGFVAADLRGLCTEAILGALRRHVDSGSAMAPLSRSEPCLEDFITALSHTAPSAISSSVVQRPDTTFEDVAGLEEQVKHIQTAILLPLSNPESFERLGVSPPSGVLLHGPSGSGKSMIAEVLTHS